MSHLRYLLFPFSWIYALVMLIRNRMFDVGLLTSKSYDLPVISVGNITVGGTGKTPLTEYLVRLLNPHTRCALLSRGYGRKNRGVRHAGPGEDCTTIGDEPRQMQQKFKQLMITVAEKRTEGMDALLARTDPPEVVIMDDAYQHRYVSPGLSILVTDYFRPLWKDHCLPSGNLREPFRGRNRADIVVVNKCPDNLTPKEADRIKKKLKMRHAQPVFFTAIQYGEAINFHPEWNQNILFKELLVQLGRPLITVAGIGNPHPFFRAAEEFGMPIIPMQFPDHHHFTASDIRKIETAGHLPDRKSPLILTTEKDAVRLALIKNLPDQLKKRIWYIPIELKFLFDEQSLFDQKIIEYVGPN